LEELDLTRDIFHQAYKLGAEQRIGICVS